PVAGKRPRASTVTTDRAALATASARLSEYFCASLIVRSSPFVVVPASHGQDNTPGWSAPPPLGRSATRQMVRTNGPILDGDQAAPDGNSHRLGPGGGPQLGHGRAQVKFDRVLADAELERDRLIGLPGSHLAQHLRFARGQARGRAIAAQLLQQRGSRGR